MQQHRILAELMAETQELLSQVPSTKRFLYKHLLKEQRVRLTGLRGTGKTTLLLQLAQHFPNALYLSSDHVDYDLKEVIKAYFQRYPEGVLLWDEAQYYKEWGRLAKYLADRYPKARIYISGSNALSLQFNADIVRRYRAYELSPLSFCEWLMLEKNTNLEPPRVEEAFLHHSIPPLEDFLLQLIDLTQGKLEESFYEFLLYGGFPFTKAHHPIREVAFSVIDRDFPVIENVESSTLQAAKHVLMSVARLSQTGPLSLEKIRENEYLRGISMGTLVKILDMMEKSGLVFSVSRCGSIVRQHRKPKKRYLPSPSMVAAFNYWHPHNLTTENRGYLLETYAANYLHKLANYYSLPFCYGEKKEPDFKLGEQKIEVKSHRARTPYLTLSLALEVSSKHIPLYVLCF
ncbi:MAG: AAA family ATPase [Candidatus Micrarchaeota archaeon]|nr:AAA family ATPase [Candidatus Micrarchaeota archaeon]